MCVLIVRAEGLTTEQLPPQPMGCSALCCFCVRSGSLALRLILHCPDSGSGRFDTLWFDPLDGSDHPHDVGAAQGNPFITPLAGCFHV